MIDTRITEPLAREGMAREIVRQVQDLRKKSNLAMEDRITLYLETDSPSLRQAIQEHQSYIANETLTTEWAQACLNGQGYQVIVKIYGLLLVIELQKVSQL
jgi:isoleucyl-tRNA synthetase